MNQRISQRAFDLIVRFETGGKKFYETKYKSRPCWPGGSSGVTIGCGYDLAYEKTFRADWNGRLPAGDMDRLARCYGKTGSAGKQARSGVADIVILWDTAIAVFNDVNLPAQIRKTLMAFPKAAEKLSANAFGALVSVVFNRGPGIDDSPRRREMRNIRELIAARDIVGQELHKGIASQIRKMARLWEDDPDSDGDLVDRRHAEAELVLAPDS